MTGVGHRDDASQRPGAMSTGHLAPVAASAIVGGQTVFGPGRVGDGKQGKGKENTKASTSIHDKISRRPGNTAAGRCKAIAAKACPFKHGGGGSRGHGGRGRR